MVLILIIHLFFFFLETNTFIGFDGIG